MQDKTTQLAALLNAAKDPSSDIDQVVGAVAQLKLLADFKTVEHYYKLWVSCHPAHPHRFGVLFNYGVELAGTGDFAGAITVMQSLIESKPDFYPPYINIGNYYEYIGRADLAVAVWNKLADDIKTIDRQSIFFKFTAFKLLAKLYEANNRDHEAEECLKNAILLNEHDQECLQHWVGLRQKQCKWPIFDELQQIGKPHLLKSIVPLSLGYYADDPLFQLSNAARYTKALVGVPDQFYAPSDYDALKSSTKKIRIGYVSSDFRDHAVGFALKELIALHNRDDFEIFGYYCGSVKHEDEAKLHFKAKLDRWTDISEMNDQAACELIRGDRINILIDLNGHTKDARTALFALRPAPIIVNWFGYPGTMGSSFHDYIIADDFIIPETHEHYYSEKVVRLPCYQPNDSNRIVAAHRPSRREAGLPDGAFVFCSMNGLQKLNSTTLKLWLRILAQVDKSVLWLLAGTDATNQRLKDFAQAHGIDPSRLIFMGRQANPEHLARYPLADLFLDNMPYGAHTTASDSLWMEVPVLTLPGTSFASRVCGSLVRAAGLSEMIASDADDYVRRAVHLGNHRSEVEALKLKLRATKKQAVLFDSGALRNNIEMVYRQMWSDFKTGNFQPKTLARLDLYHDVAVKIHVAQDEALFNFDAAVYEAEFIRQAAFHRLAPEAAASSSIG
jgi:predicted O-linked N-acetylglucosamine transferase (SPINDLY family)